jgi:hypothetical protein
MCNEAIQCIEFYFTLAHAKKKKKKNVNIYFIKRVSMIILNLCLIMKSIESHVL